jgi:hypothetical protein
MTYALLKWMYGSDKVDGRINDAEYSPHLDPNWDPYSKIFNVRENLDRWYCTGLIVHDIGTGGYLFWIDQRSGWATGLRLIAQMQRILRRSVAHFREIYCRRHLGALMM